MTAPLISPIQAAILGVVEGLTEFLPVSSTGHLILTSAALKLDLKDPGVDAFLVVIQAGALLAVIGLYWKSVVRMLKGLAGKDPDGLRLFLLLVVAFIPAAIMGALFGSKIKAKLFFPAPVAIALAVGGVAMIVLERIWRARGKPLSDATPFDIKSVTWRMALIIGLAQCLALFPGTSRSMVTILGAMLVGLSARDSAEFSFLLALPTLGAATAKDLLSDHAAILNAAGTLGLFIGFGVSCVVAAIAVKLFVQYLTRHGLSAFGYYRIALAAAVLVSWSR